jgi:hypothetical protein
VAGCFDLFYHGPCRPSSICSTLCPTDPAGVQNALCATEDGERYRVMEIVLLSLPNVLVSSRSLSRPTSICSRTGPRNSLITKLHTASLYRRRFSLISRPAPVGIMLAPVRLRRRHQPRRCVNSQNGLLLTHMDLLFACNCRFDCVLTCRVHQRRRDCPHAVNGISNKSSHLAGVKQGKREPSGSKIPLTDGNLTWRRRPSFAEP